MILLLFFCSGATALIYEVIWSKYLTLLFGSTIEAQTVVLAVFMGGLALGNKLFGRHADRATRPLSLYGRIEIAIGIYAFLFPLLEKIADAIFTAIGAKLLDHPGSLLVFKGLLSAALLLLPTILMGGTLPVLAAWLQKTTPDAGRRSARFYSTNSLGAVCGAGLAGFVFVQYLGLRLTMEMAALVNVIIGLIAISLAKMKMPLKPNEPVAAARSAESPGARSVFHWSCILVALTGGVSMGLEVLASRCLALIFGASLQVFSIVLMAFILGIGVGSAVIASPRWKSGRREILTTVLLLFSAVAIGLLVFNIERLALFYLYAQGGLSRSEVGYWYHQIFTSVAAICVLGLPAAALGAVLPLWIRAVSETSDLLGDRVGRLLTWNTIGAVIGVLLTGFVFMPQIGLRGSFALLAFVLALAVILIGAASRRWALGTLGVVCGIWLAYVSMNGAEDWRNVLSAGVFHMQDMDFSQKDSPLKSFLDYRRNHTRILFYEDAADATVSVEQVKTPDAANEITLRINGKPDATAYGDRCTQILLAQLPLMAKPDSTDVFCFGMGSGTTAGSTLGYPIKHLTIAENSEPVLRAVKLFAQWNRGVYTNDRVRIYHEDARTVLKLSPQKYDVIISEPSNPWMVGIGSVFSREFYQLAAGRLKPGGIMCQWFHMYEMDDRTLNVVLRTFNSIFPKMEIWDAGGQDVILLGSDREWKSDVDVYKQAFGLDLARSDLASIGAFSPEGILARQFASQKTAFAVVGPGQIQSDDLPVLEYRAPKAFYMFMESHEGLVDFDNYDERTWQVRLAPKDKNDILSRLTLDDLAPIFHNNSSSGNGQLQAYLDNLFSGHSGSMTVGDRVMPCVFPDPGARILIYASPDAKTNLVTRRLYFDEVALLNNDPSVQSNAVVSIKTTLDNLQNYDPMASGWPADHYADLAIKVSLQEGNVVQAKAILARGLQLEPDSEELQYLSRVIAGI